MGRVVLLYNKFDRAKKEISVNRLRRVPAKRCAVSSQGVYRDLALSPERPIYLNKHKCTCGHHTVLYRSEVLIASEYNARREECASVNCSCRNYITTIYYVRSTYSGNP